MHTDFYEAYHFLNEHHIFENKQAKQVDFLSSLDVSVVKVDPTTNAIENEKSRNTQVAIWLETGPYEETEDFRGYTHDIDLDTGGATFEEAIVRLANLVYEKYGSNPEGYGEMTEEEAKSMHAFFEKLQQKK